MDVALTRRIMKETERLEKDPVPGLSAKPHEDNLRYFDVRLEGPSETPYEGGTFRLELFLPDGYPMVPPKVRFLTKVRRGGRLCAGSSRARAKRSLRSPFGPRCHAARAARWGAARAQPPRAPLTPFARSLPAQIYHPNIDKVGRICLDILKDKWSPALQIRHVLLSIGALMSTPAPDDPLANDVAEVWKANQPKALQTAREWTRLYVRRLPPPRARGGAPRPLLTPLSLFTSSLRTGL